MKSQPKLLLTNDDGIDAIGLKVLWKALRKAGYIDIKIIAPASEQSGTGVSITWDRPILVKPHAWEEDTPAWSVDGTPADCVKMASRIILDSPPDFVVSGVNAGSNAGRNVLHSGTVGACIEGVFRGIPGVAFSCENGRDPNFHVAEKYIGTLMQYALDNPLPPGTFLNVNFPHAAQDEVKGFRLTRQGEGRWLEDPSLHVEKEQGTSYWMGGKPQELNEREECDIAFLRQGYLTAVPIHVHELTDHLVIKEGKKAFEKLHMSSPS